MFLNAQNLLLKLRLKRPSESKPTLEDVEKVVREELTVDEDVEDITEIIRQMRERDYKFEY
ncbi:hypothetical protein E3E42_02805 [Thermococcus sp. JdF3]|nr:hypothetical protein [Thermococcus sp. JdF3]